MSQKQQMEIRALQEEQKTTDKRLDKLEKRVILLKRAISHMQRSPATKTGVKVPRTPLPDALDELEIGTQPKGT